MSEPLLKRVQRVVAAKTEAAVDAVERLSGASLLRHAVRELDQAADKLEGQKRKAFARQQQAERDLTSLGARLRRLEEDARFALQNGREDLAQQSLANQLELEKQIAKVREAQRLASGEATRLDEERNALAGRRARMTEDLDAAEAAERAARAATSDVRVQRKVQRAEAAFQRAREAAGVVAGPAGDADRAIAEMRRDEAVAERLAALRAQLAPAGGKPPKRKARG